MVLADVPTPVVLLGGLVGMALSAHYMTARSKTGFISNVAAVINIVCFLNLSLGVEIWMALFYLFLRPFSGPLVRRLNSNVAEAVWADAMSAILPPTKMVVSGEWPEDDTQAIVIANHQIDADFWFVFEVMRRLRRQGALKIILKDDEKHVPIVGWGMQGFGFIFLRRDWTKDRTNLEKQLAVFTGDNFPLRLLIFPEGTTVNQRSMEKCATFAKKEQRPTFNHLLLPRTTGFGACLEAFSLAQNPDTRDNLAGDGWEEASFSNRVVYDFTIAYTGFSGEIPTWEMGFTRKKDVDIPSLLALARGRAPGPVHVHIEKHRVEDIRDGGKSWLDATWARKDALMDKFIKSGRFPHEPIEVFESRKSPLSFLLASATPILAGWLIYTGIVDLMTIMFNKGS
ncbi:unnamed protein product [Ascophyllum nodosum]